MEDGRLYMRVFSSKVRAVLLSHPVVSKGLFTLIEISLRYNITYIYSFVWHRNWIDTCDVDTAVLRMYAFCVATYCTWLYIWLKQINIILLWYPVACSAQCSHVITDIEGSSFYLCSNLKVSILHIKVNRWIFTIFNTSADPLIR